MPRQVIPPCRRVTYVERTSIHIKISAPSGCDSAYVGGTSNLIETPACSITASPAAIAANTSAHPRTNGSATNGTTLSSNRPRICSAHAPQLKSSDREEILGRPANDIPNARVPSQAHRSPRRADTRARSRRLCQLSKLDVVHHFHREPLMRAQFLVRAPADHLKRAHAHVTASCPERSRAMAARRAQRQSRKTSAQFFRLRSAFRRSPAATSDPTSFACKSERASQQIRREMKHPRP